MRRVFLAMAMFLLGGCGSGAAYKPAEKLAPVPAVPSVTPAAGAAVGAVAAMEPPLIKIETAAPALTAANVEVQRPLLVGWVGQMRAAWNQAAAAVRDTQGQAKANDQANGEVMAAVKARDAEIERLDKQSADQQAQIVAAASDFQKKLNVYAVLLTVVVAVVVGLLCYQTQFKAAICTALGGAGAVLFLLLVGWVDRFKLEIAMGFVVAGLLYLVAETLYRHIKNNLSIGAALRAALTESPLAA